MSIPDPNRLRLRWGPFVPDQPGAEDGSSILVAAREGGRGFSPPLWAEVRWNHAERRWYYSCGGWGGEVKPSRCMRTASMLTAKQAAGRALRIELALRARRGDE